MRLGLTVIGAVLALGMVAFVQGADIGSQVTVGNAAPSVSAVSVNAGSPITVTNNTTTPININYTVTDQNGCGDVFYSGNATTTLYRTGVSSTCYTTFATSGLNCYVTIATTTNNCPSATSSNTSANATITLQVYYFAQPTDGSSTFSAEFWNATVIARDAANSTSGANGSNVELNTLTAISVTTSSINYGAVPAGTNTGATNQFATTTNAGNSSTTLRLYASSTLASGANSIATSSQGYSTSSFTYPGTSTALTASAVTVAGFSLVPATSTNGNPNRLTYWGLNVPGGTPSGTYVGTTVFQALWVQ